MPGAETVNSILVIAASLVATLVLIRPRVARARLWRATVTPLASIIGSGFLVLGPILKHSFGIWGIGVMASLCLFSYCLGNAIRFNIRQYSNDFRFHAGMPGPVRRLESLASIALVVAYVISITYYLNLFGAFAVSLTSVNEPLHSRLVTTALICFIAIFGASRGFSALEAIEEGTVGLKLAMICGLLVGLLALFFESLSQGTLDRSADVEFRWSSVAIALGLVITVQGFETSRYLGNEFDVETRIRSMRLAQWLSTGIYMVFIVLVTFCFSIDEIENRETAIIGMTGLVAPVLPAMLVAAALASQLSAAVADTGGCGGLAEEVSHGRIKSKTAYLVLGVLSMALTWTSDIYSIISYASRAFAVYYAIQCAIAATFAAHDRKHRFRFVFYSTLVLLAILVVFFGRPVESME